MATLEVTSRTPEEKPEQLRAQGLIPAVFYGKKEESTSISVSQKDFTKLWKEAGESTVITLKIDGKEDIEVLIHDVQLDPLTDSPIHVDFYAFERGVALEMEVALEYVGVAPAVKSLGGSLVKVMHELPIKALPKDLPHSIEVDISGLVDFDTNLTAGDIKLPEGVELDIDSDAVVATADAPHEAEPDEESGDIDMSAVEVEKKGKEESEEGEAGEE